MDNATLEGTTGDEVDFLCRIGHRPIESASTDTYAPSSYRCCERDLAGSAPRPDTWASAIACPVCGSVYFVELGLHPSDEPIDAVVLTSGTETTNAQRPLAPVTTALATTLMADLFGPTGVTAEHRRYARHTITAPLVGVPLDKGGQPLCEAIDLTLTDVSVAGVGLLRRGDIPGELLAIDFSPAGYPGHQLVGRVRWRRRASGLTKIGCEFVRVATVACASSWS